MPAVKFLGPSERSGGTEEVHVDPVEDGDEAVVLRKGGDGQELSEGQLKAAKALPGLRFSVGGEVTVTDAAEAKAVELGVDLAEVEGTGKDGTVTVDDVEKAAD